MPNENIKPTKTPHEQVLEIYDNADVEGQEKIRAFITGILTGCRMATGGDAQ